MGSPQAVHHSQLRCAALSDVGRIRSNNEDSYMVDPDQGVYAVADGMGGHAAGEVASRMAVEAIGQAVTSVPDAEFLREASLANRRVVLDWLADTVDAVNAKVFAASQESEQVRGMGCTLDVVLVRGWGAFIAHVGDSRVYVLRGGELTQLTEDHTLGQILWQGGRLTREQLEKHPQKNVLVRALGVFPKVQVDTLFFELAPGDRLLLCSDGLYNEVPEEKMARLLGQGEFQNVPGALIQAALDAGGHDNVSCVVVGVDEGPAQRRPTIGSDDTRRALRRTPLFASLTEAERMRIQKIASEKEVPEGGVVFETGDPGDALYVVISGRLSVRRGTVAISEIGPGDHFGEMALIDDTARSATVRAETTSRLLAFPRAEFEGLVAADLALAAKIFMGLLGRLSLRIRELNNEIAVYRRALAQGLQGTGVP
jgi:serine/threonine protein phosphatase PrpC